MKIKKNFAWTLIYGLFSNYKKFYFSKVDLHVTSCFTGVKISGSLSVIDKNLTKFECPEGFTDACVVCLRKQNAALKIISMNMKSTNIMEQKILKQ